MVERKCESSFHQALTLNQAEYLLRFEDPNSFRPYVPQLEGMPPAIGVNLTA
jgi:hypothetical protein